MQCWCNGGALQHTLQTARHGNHGKWMYQTCYKLPPKSLLTITCTSSKQNAINLKGYLLWSQSCVINVKTVYIIKAALVKIIAIENASLLKSFFSIKAFSPKKVMLSFAKKLIFWRPYLLIHAALGINYYCISSIDIYGIARLLDG